MRLIRGYLSVGHNIYSITEEHGSGQKCGVIMFEELYQQAHVLARHREAAHAQERVEYLKFLAAEGWAGRALIRRAELVLGVVRVLPLTSGEMMTHEKIQRGADEYLKRMVRYARGGDRKHVKKRFIREATRWFRFLNRLREPNVKSLKNEEVLSDFRHWMKHERGLSDRTIHDRDRWIREFLAWYESRSKRGSLSTVSARDVDRFFTESNQNQRWSRVTVAGILDALRSFFRYAANRGLCPRLIAEGLPGPRIYKHSNLPLGPKREVTVHSSRLVLR